MLDAYWAAQESAVPKPRGEGMRIKRIMLALTALVAGRSR